MNYIVDTSALIQGYITDPNSARMRMLVKMTYENTVVLHILDFGLSECLNIVWKRVLFHGLPLEAAKRAIKSLSVTPLTVHPPISYYNRALEIGVNSICLFTIHCTSRSLNRCKCP